MQVSLDLVLRDGGRNVEIVHPLLILFQLFQSGCAPVGDCIRTDKRGVCFHTDYHGLSQR